MFGGGSDPYVIVLTDPPQLINMGTSTVKTEIIMHDLNPVWKTVLSLSFKSDDYSGIADNAHLFFSVWDYDKFSEDDLIGIFAISMKELINHLRGSESYDFDTALISNGEIQGDLSGTITCVDSKGIPILLPPESISSFSGASRDSNGRRLARQGSQAVRYQTLAEATESPFADIRSCCVIA